MRFKQKKRKKGKRSYLKGVFVTLELPELSNHAIELVFADRVAFLFPFADSDDGTAFWVHQAHKPPAQRVSPSSTATAFVDGACQWTFLPHRRSGREVPGGREAYANGADQHVFPTHSLSLFIYQKVKPLFWPPSASASSPLSATLRPTRLQSQQCPEQHLDRARARARVWSWLVNGL